MKRVALAILLLAATCGVAGAQTRKTINEEKRRDIVRLLELMKAADLGTEFLKHLTDELQSSFASLPEENRERIFKIYEEEYGKEFSREKIIEVAVPIYDKYLSAEDLKGLLEFYDTPLGRRVIGALPAIMREANEDGARRGRAVGMRVIARITSEGLLTTPEPPPAPKPKPRPRRRRG
jgi:hypothetical protein